MNEAAMRLPIVDGLTLDRAHRALLRPGELLSTRTGEVHRLPRFFFAIESSAAAVEAYLTPNFGLWEFLEVDVREAELLRSYPRYVPCAVTTLASSLEVLRAQVGATIRIAANGGYRSPAHAGSASGSPHCWGTAANIYRIGADYLDNQEKIARFAELATRAIAGCWVRPFGAQIGFTDDHLHIDLGYVSSVPHHLSESQS